MTKRFALAFALMAPAIVTLPAYAQDVAATQAAIESHNGSEVLATVGSEKVTLADAIMIYRTLPPQIASVPAEKIMPQITDQLINETALYQKALESGLAETREMEVRLAAMRRSALAEAYLTEKLRTRVNEEMVREEFEKFVSEFEAPIEVRASHILVETEDEAKALIAELEGGADFAELAKAKSNGPSGSDGGDLGYFGSGAMVPAFDEATFALTVDEISAPVQTNFGWHVIKLVDRREKDVVPPTFDQVAPSIEQEITRRVAQEIIDEARGATEVTVATEQPPAMLIAHPEILKN